MSQDDILLPNGASLSREVVRQLSWNDETAGSEWFDRLPALLREYCDAWNIQLEPGIPQLNYNLVLFGTTPDTGPVMIKTGPPNREMTAEISALRVPGREGVVRVIDADPSVSIMLQERVVPGTSLNEMMDRGEISDEDATVLVAEAMQRFWIAPPIGARIIPLRSWFKALDDYVDAHPDGTGAIPGHMIEVAIGLADHLLNTTIEPMVLHGDLNPGNILWDETNGWTIIDPKGLLGPRGYEIGTWMINPYGLHARPDLRETLDRRLDQFARLLGIERHRLWQWSVVHAVLSECWTLEGGGVEPDHLHALEVANVLLQLPDAGRQ